MANIIEIIVKAKTEGEGQIKGLSLDFLSLEKISDEFGKDLVKLAKDMTGFFTTVGGLKSIITESIRVFASFDDMMRQVGAVSGATGEQFEELTALARKMGEETRFTASEAAEALKYLSMAGLRVNESMEALPHTLNLAAAGAIDLGRSADLLTNVMAGYGIEASGLAKVNDVLVATFTRSNANLEELADGFKYVGPVAKSLGIEIEETSAVLGTLASSGYKAEQGGAALRNIFLALVAPTSNAGKMFQKLGVDTEELGLNLADQSSALKSLGVEINDAATGQMKPFADIMDQITSGLSQFNDKTVKAGLVAQIFGKRSVGPMLALLNKGGETVRAFADEIKNSGGIAERVATQMEAGLGGAFRVLRSQIEAVYIDIGKELNPELSEATRTGNEMLKTVRSTAAVSFGMMVGDLIAMVSSFKDISGSGKVFELTIQSIAMGITIISTGLQTIIFGLKQGVQAALWVIYDSLEGVFSMSAAVVSIFSKEWGDTLRYAAADMQKFKHGIENDILKTTEEYISRVGAGVTRIRALIDEVDKGAVKNKQVFSDLIREVADFEQQVAKGTLTQGEINKKIEEFQGRSVDAFKAGSEDLKKFNDVLDIIRSSTDAATNKTKDFVDLIKQLGLVSASSSQEVTDAGQATVAAFVEISDAAKTISLDMTASSDQIMTQLELIEQKAMLAGDALLEAFSGGIAKSTTIGDVTAMVRALEQAFIDQKISLEAVEQGWQMAEEKAADLAAQAISTATSIFDLKEIFDAMRESNLSFSDVLESKLIPALQNLSTADLGDLKAQLDTLFKQGIVDAGTFNAVVGSISNVIGEKLGVATRNFATNITHAVSDSLEQFSLLRSDIGVTGEVLTEAFSNIVEKASTKEDIEEIRAALEEMADAGVLSQEELAQSAKELDGALQDIVTTSAAGQEAIDQLSVAQQQFNEAISSSSATLEEMDAAYSDLEYALTAAMESGAISAEEMDSQLAGAKEQLEAVRAEAAATEEELERLAQAMREFEFTIPWSEEIVTDLQDIGVEIENLIDFIQAKARETLSLWGEAGSMSMKEMELQMRYLIDATKGSLEELDTVMQMMTDTGRDLTGRAYNIIDSMRILDDQSLDDLRGQVQGLRDDLESAYQAAADLVFELTTELLQAQGQQAKIEEMQYEKQKAEIEALLEAADDRTREQYEEALRILEEIHQRKMQDIAEEEEAQRASADRVYEHEESKASEMDEERGSSSSSAPDVTRIVEETRIIDNRVLTINTPYETTAEWFEKDFLPVYLDWERRTA